jgi:hypothetical protein
MCAARRTIIRYAIMLAVAVAASAVHPHGTAAREHRGASHAEVASAVDDRPRLAPAPPIFTARADDEHVYVTWQSQTVDVRTAVIGGARVWQRAIAVRQTHVEVRDTIANATSALVGLRIRHAVDAIPPVHLGGRRELVGTDAYDPWNPTVFTATANGGVGLVAEDDVLRQQLHVDYAASDRSVGLRTDMLCLAPGDRVTLVWSIYPTSTAYYWDFINAVRRDWNVNRTVPGSYIWFTPDTVRDLSLADLRAMLQRRRVAIASMWGGWVDPRRSERPPIIGFGTGVLSDTFANYRTRIRAAVAKLKAARPEVKVLLYFDAQRDTLPDATTRYADSLLLAAGGAVERTDWQGAFSSTWGMVPTTTNTYGRALREVAHAMRELGADGLYWDEMDGVDYSRPRLTTAPWDRRSCVLTEHGEVTAKVGLVNLLSEDAKLEYAGAGFVLGNMPPTTRHFQDRADLRMVEAQHNDTWGSFAHLTTPLGYLSARVDWPTMVRKIDEGVLPVSARLDDQQDLNARLFPFTPEYLQLGTLRGRERIITTRTGTHGWTSFEGSVRAFRYDSSGKEHEAAWPVKHEAGGTFIDVALAPGEVAVIERGG